MSKLLRISTIILAFFATISITFAQTIAESPKRSPAEYAALIKKGKLDISPASTFSDPYMLAHIWIDEAVPVNKYSKKEREWQKTLNAEMEDLIWAYSPIEDSEVYQNDNYSLSVEQRDIDNEPITPYTWKWIDFERDEADGSKTIANLKRPNWWIKQLGAEKVGNQVYLRISEQGISGNFIVKKIRPCQSDTRFMELKRKNDYVLRPITGKFEHKSYDVWEFEFDNGEVIGCTPTHPFYSEKRQAYIPVGDIEFGEPIKNKGGKTITLKSKKKKEGGETVYNLEIYRDHNFMVGKSGLLVHNSCTVYSNFTKPIEFGGDIVKTEGKMLNILGRVGGEESIGSLNLYNQLIKKGLAKDEITVLLKPMPEAWKDLSIIDQNTKYWQLINKQHIDDIIANGGDIRFISDPRLSKNSWNIVSDLPTKTAEQLAFKNKAISEGLTKIKTFTKMEYDYLVKEEYVLQESGLMIKP